ncbi:MAG: class I SAM-dependent methyltransferase, partial [Chloroflexi bacterium]
MAPSSPRGRAGLPPDAQGPPQRPHRSPGDVADPAPTGEGVSTVSAFDAVAASYDATFTHTPLGRRLREAVWTHLAAAFRPGHHVLELGCGTGEDALWLARRGVRVTATDASPAMLAIARHKAEAARLTDRITCARLDLAAPEREWPSGPIPRRGPYDGAFANFGVLNGLPDRRPLAQALARWVRPGGQVILVVMGPLCPWEIGWHLLHGQVRTALRRFRSGVEAHIGGGA